MQISEKAAVAITSFLGTVNFENTDPFYRRGIPFFGTVGLTTNKYVLISLSWITDCSLKFSGHIFPTSITHCNITMSDILGKSPRLKESERYKLFSYYIFTSWNICQNLRKLQKTITFMNRKFLLSRDVTF